MTYQTTINVEAVQWTGDNFEEIKAKFPHIKPELMDDKLLIIMSQSISGNVVSYFKCNFDIGNWITYQVNENSYKYYTDSDFHAKFNPITQDHLEL